MFGTSKFTILRISSPERYAWGEGGGDRAELDKLQRAELLLQWSYSRPQRDHRSSSAAVLAQRSAGLADAERVWVRLCNRSARWSLDILHHFYLSEEQAVNVLGRTIVGWKILPWQLSVDMVLCCAAWRTRMSQTSTIGVWSRAGPFGTRPNWELSNRVFDPQDDRQHLPQSAC